MDRFVISLTVSTILIHHDGDEQATTYSRAQRESGVIWRMLTPDNVFTVIYPNDEFETLFADPENAPMPVKPNVFHTAALPNEICLWKI